MVYTIIIVYHHISNIQYVYWGFFCFFCDTFYIVIDIPGM